MRFDRILGSVSTVLIASMPVSALAEKPLTVTLSTNVSPQYMSGDLIGCQLGFEVVRHDPEYSKGNLVYLTGNIGFKAFDGKELAYTLKLGVKNLESDKFSPPADAYFMSGYATNATDFISSQPGEEGFQLFLFRVGDTSTKAIFGDLAKDNKIIVAYAMERGGLNAIVPINLMIVRADLNDLNASEVNDSTVTGWSQCIDAVINASRQRLSEKGKVP